MKFLQYIQIHKTGPSCEQCIHFQGEPGLVEHVYSGLTTMSSGFASVRDKDGFCGYHQLYLSGRDSCPHLVIKEPNR